MAHDSRSVHTYVRELNPETMNSLAKIAHLIGAGAKVLDVGTGSGALGKYLKDRKQCAIDGVTYNQQEADLAAPYYDNILVADLDVASLENLFPGARYDFIICADVLEHLRAPERILASCRNLLAAHGQVLISIPNVAYVGLIGELLAGEFKYRPEGLLDNTHIRFFTRHSLQRFLQDNQWQTAGIDTVQLNPKDSEFSTYLDALPPALQNYLYTQEDAFTYQFIVQAFPTNTEIAGTDIHSPGPSLYRLPHFVSALYFETAQGWHEENKILARGEIGNRHQRVVFPLALPPDTKSLRLDIADRPGLLFLHSLQLQGSEGVLWAWDGDTASLASAPSQQIVFNAPYIGHPGALILLTGDDPAFELPLPPEVRSSLGAATTLVLELGWPMTADFLPYSTSHSRIEQAYQRKEQELISRIALLQDKLAENEASLGALRSAHELLQTDIAALKTDNGSLSDQLIETKVALDQAMSEREQLRQYLHLIENSRLFRATRPISKAKMAFDRLFKGSPAPAEPSNPVSQPSSIPLTPLVQPVDVIVPIYKGLEDTRRCVESVLQCDTKTPYRLVLINDASPEQSIWDYLETLKDSQPNILVLHNEENLGFVRTVNRGMELNRQADVLLLNSDTEVANDWLDRMVRAAYSDDSTGTVTPFSNNATIFSYPEFCKENPLPKESTAEIDGVFAQANAGRYVQVPTAMGFCMYIRRACLEATGLFNAEVFGKGYGEENDFCLRASQSGWKHLHALDTYVLHTGGVSFGESKDPRVHQALDALRRMYPRYESDVHHFIADDPARPARLAADIGRIQAKGLPCILFISHAREGGTIRHIWELAEELDGRAQVLNLQPEHGGCTLTWLKAGETFRLSFDLPDEYSALVTALESLGVAHLHYHHLLGHNKLVWQLPEDLGVGFDFTAHDFYAVCPQITLTNWTNQYCGEEGLEQCKQCLRHSPAPDGVSIDAWRASYRHFLKRARYVFTPSQDTADRLRHYIHQGNLIPVGHTDLNQVNIPTPEVPPLPPGRPLRICVVGALSVIKGADLLEDVAVEAAKRGTNIEFHLIGYAYRSLITQPKSRLTVHGAYAENDLDTLLEWLKPDLVWFPALWPETYSYTLSACLKAGLPIVAPNIGAFPERLADRPWTWVYPVDTSVSKWLQVFQDALTENFIPGVSPPAPKLAIPLGDSFDYQAQYLSGIPLKPAQIPDSDFLFKHGSDRKQGLTGVRSSVKNKMLITVVRLRSAPLLRSVARQIPLRWQTRLKTWLQS